jgi:DNA-binding SARP family transcriptional activator
MLHLATLGTLSITSPDGAASGLASRRRALALLVLAGSGREGITRDRVMALLWSELDAASARNNLKQTVFTIRHALGVDPFDRSTANICLDRDVVTVDAHEFERALETCALERAVELYAGPFLDGFFVPRVADFDQWVERVRARLAWKHALALETVMAKAKTRGDARAAVQWCQRLVEHDPLSTAYALGLISALADAGEPLRALDHARTYANLIRAEFDAEPDQRIALAAERVRQSLSYPVAKPQADQGRPAASSGTFFVQRDGGRPRRPSGPLHAGA